MTRNNRIEIIGLPAKAFSCKSVTHIEGKTGGYRQAKINQFTMHACFRLGKIHKSQCKFAAGQMTEQGKGGIRQLPPGEFALFRFGIGSKNGTTADQEGRTALFILVDPEKVFILHESNIFRLQGTEISTHHQRDAAQTPQGELQTVFLIGANFAETDIALAAHSDSKHIHVIETVRAAHAEIIQLGLENVREGNIVIHNITGGTVHMRPAAAHPLPGVLLSPVTGREKNIPSGSLKGHGHRLIAIAAVSGFREIAEIIFQKIHTPGGKGFCILGCGFSEI